MTNQWDASFDFEKYAVLINKDNKIFIIKKEFANLDIDHLKVNSLGLYIGELKDNTFRLSIEGSQLIGPLAKKNTIELSREELKEWLKGTDIDYTGECEGFVLVRYGDEFAGSGRIKDGKILNFVPKIRRLNLSS